MRACSYCPDRSNRHSSTFSACAENSAKLTPLPSQVAPSGYGSPGHTLVDGISPPSCAGVVGWVEQRETHHGSTSADDGFRCALPILRLRRNSRLGGEDQ